MKPLVIVGPTASGKTALSFAIAKAYSNVDILVVDSKQVYRGQDIVTGKDLPTETTARIFGTDLVNPDEQWSVAQFIPYAQEVIKNAQRDKRFLIIVVGTPQYFLSLIDPPMTAVVPQNQNLRKQLDRLSVSELQQKLNPERLALMNNSDRNNPRRLVRAIEVAQAPTNLSKNTKSDSGLSSAKWIGLNIDTKNLERRIRQRVIDRIEKGAHAEYDELYIKYPHWTKEAYSAIGYAEINDTFTGKLATNEDLIDMWTLHEVQYAKRQMQWWKKRTEITWFDPTDGNYPQNVIEYIHHELDTN